MANRSFSDTDFAAIAASMARDSGSTSSERVAQHLRDEARRKIPQIECDIERLERNRSEVQKVLETAQAEYDRVVRPIEERWDRWKARDLQDSSAQVYLAVSEIDGSTMRRLGAKVMHWESTLKSIDEQLFRLNLWLKIGLNLS